jgi:hypothetical protein
MGRRAWALDRWLRSSRHFHQHFHRFDHRLLPYVITADSPKSLLFMCDATVSRSYREVNKADRLSRRRPSGPCNASNGDRKIDVSMLERAERHRNRNFLADGAECFEF